MVPWLPDAAALMLQNGVGSLCDMKGVLITAWIWLLPFVHGAEQARQHVLYYGEADRAKVLFSELPALKESGIMDGCPECAGEGGSLKEGVRLQKHESKKAIFG